MSTYPLDDEHLDALRWVCKDPAAAAHIESIGFGESPETDALRAISSPASAASLLRDLLARAGSSVDIEHHRGVQWRIVYYVGDQRVWFAINWANGEIVPDVTRIISALASLAPGDRDGAMRALR